ncbi:MAG: class I SAM-dependent methyltransferase [Planctomycetes bacterium]|nr:class I SAM-dependent methyltransferase [Planctomycetota bacterium]
MAEPEPPAPCQRAAGSDRPLVDEKESALCELGEALKADGYRFTTPTPETHRRVNARAGNERARNLRDVFGWSRPFPPDLVPAPMIALLEQAGQLDRGPAGLRSRVRFSTLDERLHVHSAYPTVEADAVFFGPDTYRFASFVGDHARDADCVVDIGCGSGAGGLSYAARAKRVILADISAKALSFARVNTVLAGVAHADVVQSDVLAGIPDPIDVVIANPPYLVDPQARIYRDGGGALGIGLAVRIVRESLARLQPGGRLILYTGTPIIAGRDPFWEAILPAITAAGAAGTYREIDPDVFGEELESPAYADADRLAVVGLVAESRSR